MVEEVSYDLGRGATIVRAADGGPIRNPLTGRRSNTTHTHTSAKTGYNSIPADSNLEYAAMWIMDVSVWVLRYMSQPHRLVFPMVGFSRVAEYTPDLELVVPRSFVAELARGASFVRTALKCPPRRAACDALVTLYVEVKRNNDRRANTEGYQTKINEARKIYQRAGCYFFYLEETPHLDAIRLDHLPSIEMDEAARVDVNKLTCAAWDHLSAHGGLSTYGAISDALGGNEAVNCLHVKGRIWIDLTCNPNPSTSVRMPPLLGERKKLPLLLQYGREI